MPSGGWSDLSPPYREGRADCEAVLGSGWVWEVALELSSVSTRTQPTSPQPEPLTPWGGEKGTRQLALSVGALVPSETKYARSF